MGLPPSTTNRGRGSLAGSGYTIPSKGDRIEHRRLGVLSAGSVWYADQLQVLVKWDNGKLSSLRIGRDFYVVHKAPKNGRVPSDPVEHGTVSEASEAVQLSAVGA
jgi:hypothetical protein